LLAMRYDWVVTCKNTGFHATRNLFNSHRIPLGCTDPYAPRPEIPDVLEIVCDDPECGNTYIYSAGEVNRWFRDITLGASHPLF
jgi:hypothetical protein